MQVIKGNKTAFFDIDHTLIFSVYERDSNRKYCHSTEINGTVFYLDEAHFNLLKEFKSRGFTVVLWSAGGWEWAEMVAKNFRLEYYVDAVVSKPDFMVDDKEPYEFMPERIYIETDDENKNA